MPDAYQTLLRHTGEIKDIENALSILSWDQEVVMPNGGAELRAHTLSSLSGVLHERVTTPEFVTLVGRMWRGRSRLPPQKRRGVELMRRRVEKARAIPIDLARELAMAESRGLESWKTARATKDFKRFAPALGHMVGLKREVARLTAKDGRLYDALLDEYEPGATTAALDPLLADLKAITVPLVKRVVDSGVKVDTRAFTRGLDVADQRAFCKSVVEAMGIDLDRGRLDLSTHPFCSGVGPDDVRMTSRYDPRDLRGGLYGAIHEAGHGLYEQGLDARRARTPLGGAISMAVHESQSRLWENNVGRGKPFWRYWLPRFKKAFPKLRGVTLDGVWRAANEMGPSFIRVEADELTYNLHIILRYEVERDLIEGSLQVKDLPKRWNSGMKQLLGVTPRNDAQGVLQDIHWAMGAFGYFPTYSVGNLYSAQFMEAARKSIRKLDDRIARGDFATLRRWLAENIHRHDQVYTAEQIVKRVTGRPLGTDAFRRYITDKVEALY